MSYYQTKSQTQIQKQNEIFSLKLNSIHAPNKLDIISIISSTIGIKEYTINLKPVEIEYIHNVIQNDPELLAIIGNSVDSIVSDGVINLHDIPMIILLLSQIFKSHFIKKFIHNIGIVNIVKFILDSIIDYEYLPLPNVERTIIRNIIDISVNLLETNITLEKKLKSSWFYRLFFCFSPLASVTTTSKPIIIE